MEPTTKEPNKETRLNVIHAVIMSAVMLLLLLFVAFPLQMFFLMPGVAATQVIVLLAAILPALILRAPLSKVFPTKVPKLRQLCAVLFFWLAMLLINGAINAFIIYFHNDDMVQRNMQITELASTIPMISGFFIIAIMPAVCEEAFFRGFLQECFNNVKNKWVTIIIIGFAFGAYHLDLSVLHSTWLFGMMLAYIMYETRNLLLPVFFHFINNGFSFVTLAFASVLNAATESIDAESVVAEASPSMFLAAAGLMLCACAAVPFLIFFAGRLLKSKNALAPVTRKPMITCAVIAVCVFVPGLVVTVLGAVEYLKDITSVSGGLIIWR